jgi:hypothetical protein
MLSRIFVQAAEGFLLFGVLAGSAVGVLSGIQANAAAGLIFSASIFVITAATAAILYVFARLNSWQERLILQQR